MDDGLDEEESAISREQVEAFISMQVLVAGILSFVGFMAAAIVSVVFIPASVS